MKRKESQIFKLTSLDGRLQKLPSAIGAEKIGIDEEAANEVAVVAEGGRGTWKHAAFHVATTIATSPHQFEMQ